MAERFHCSKCKKIVDIKADDNGVERCSGCGRPKPLGRSTGYTELLYRQDGSPLQMYHCPGASYSIEEPMCNARQKRGYKGCKKCTVRIGGKNDPRS